jgi:hypothetical protein
MATVRVACLALILTSCGNVSLAAGPAEGQRSPDVVTFSNGDILTGTILRTTSSAVYFSNPAVGSLTLAWADLRTISIQHPIRIATGSGGSGAHDFDSAVISVGKAPGGALRAEARRTGQADAVVLESVQSVTGPDPCASGVQPACPGWKIGKFKITTAIIQSTQKDQNYGAELDLYRNWHPESLGWPHEETVLQLVPTYDDKRKNNKLGSANVTEDYFGELKQLFFITSDNFYAKAVADVYRNTSLGLYFTQSYGFGLGAIVHDVELNADLRFMGEHFYPPKPSAQLVGTQLSERYSFPLGWIRPKATLSETAIATPVFNATRAWQAQGLLDLYIPITGTLGISTTASDYYVENAPSQFRKNYFKTAVGLQYTPATKH